MSDTANSESYQRAAALAANNPDLYERIRKHTSDPAMKDALLDMENYLRAFQYLPDTRYSANLDGVLAKIPSEEKEVEASRNKIMAGINVIPPNIKIKYMVDQQSAFVRGFFIEDKPLAADNSICALMDQNFAIWLDRAGLSCTSGVIHDKDKIEKKVDPDNFITAFENTETGFIAWCKQEKSDKGINFEMQNIGLITSDLTEQLSDGSVI